MLIRADAEVVEPFYEPVRGGLGRIVGYDHAGNEKPVGSESVDKSERVHIIGDTEIASDLVLFDRRRRNDDNDLGAVAKTDEHSDLAVRLKTGKHARRMVIVEKFSAEFEIKFSAETVDPFLDAFRLHFYVLVVVKSLFHPFFPPSEIAAPCPTQ